MTDDDLKATLSAKRPVPVGPISKDELLSSGSTLFNLASTGRTAGAWVKGHYYFLVGDSNSGKTWLLLSTLAEACKNKNFDDYDLIFVNAEQGVMMDIPFFFGNKLDKRLEFIDTIETVDAFYFDITDRLKKDRKFIMVVDSENALSSISDEKKFEKTKKARQKDQETTGSMGDGKAKLHSQNLRRVCSKLKRHGSILIMVGQSRADMGPMAHGGKTHSGGYALKFFAASQIFTSVKEKIKKDVLGKKREQGTMVQCRFKKNRVTGKDRVVQFPIYHSFGIDDVGGCVDYLVSEKHWKRSSAGITATELGVTLQREKLIKHIENESEELVVRKAAAKVWKKIEELTAITRKKRYD